MSEAIVNESMIQALIMNPHAQTAFPFLRTMAVRMTPRRTCCGKVARAQLNLKSVKLTLMSMDGAPLAKLKKFLGVDKLVFHIQNDKGLTRLER